jgi:formylglycine-generating enzyme required for sulfatase activity
MLLDGMRPHRTSQLPRRAFYVFIAILFALAAPPPAHAQLRPETTPQPPPEKKPPPTAKSSRIVVDTLPNAHVYLDDVFKGEASPEGKLVIDDAKPGTHKIRISLDGKKTFEADVTVVAGKEASLKAALADLPGTLLVHSSPGAAVYLDDAPHGTTDANGTLVLADASPGPHNVRVSATGKKDYKQQINIVAGQQAAVTATLAEIEKPGPPAGEVKTSRNDGLQYVWIPPGNFMMGCSPGDMACREEEKPAHLVVITKGFWIGKTEVTVAAAQRYVNANGEKMLHPPDFNPNWADQNMPMVNVSWTDAQYYCHWAGGRLPTEAEWEYAARAGNPNPDYGPLDEIAWYAENSGRKRLDTSQLSGDQNAYNKLLEKNGNGAHDVAQKRANAWGLYDMLGNASEWVADWYAPDYYRSSPAQDPQGPASGQFRVRRGAAWYGVPAFVRFSSRVASSPTERASNFGFRCVIQPE